jgi:hypothetical protein
VRLNTGSAQTGTLKWRQLTGPTVNLDPKPSTGFVAPDVRQTTDLIFELSAQINGQTLTDTVNVRVEPCSNPDGTVFGECITPGFGPFLAYESSSATGEIVHYQGYEAYMHVQWQSIDSGDAKHGRVMEIRWNANDPNHAINANGWFGLAMPGASADLQAYKDGALSFDMRLVYHEQANNAAPFIFKTECILPCTSAELPIVKGNTSFEWQTHTYPIADLVASGLNLAKVNNLWIIQPAWRNQEQNVTVQIDNIRLIKKYTPPVPADGCTAAGKVSYALTRAANPTADEKQAYDLITAAMDLAVKNYNCYTNLSRQLQVTYNPSVETADGSTNGSIRFGSRASMHHVTAMHEIAHVMGVGGSKFRTIVSGGVYNGPKATAKLREISGNASDQIKSDGTHFWPHGLNYVSEWKTQQDLINHCSVVQAIVADLAQ